MTLVVPPLFSVRIKAAVCRSVGQTIKSKGICGLWTRPKGREHVPSTDVQNDPKAAANALITWMVKKLRSFKKRHAAGSCQYGVDVAAVNAAGLCFRQLYWREKGELYRPRYMQEDRTDRSIQGLTKAPKSRHKKLDF
ncbi:MAG: hypothetical protein HFE86_07560 [Clostridiales bacterium]|nr:hypothetical protein [Clostridiales bacterium]